jgi:hypothetical protein
VRDKRLLVLLGVGGLILILLETSRYGAGLVPDSVGYISGAANLAAGLGLVSYDGTPLVGLPPLYPAVLALVSLLLKLDMTASATIVAVVLFGLIVYLSGLLLSRHLSLSPAFALLAAVSFLMSPLLMSISAIAWTEPLFIFLVLLFLLNLETYLARNDVCSFIVIALSAALACLTRYLGVTFILTGVVVIMLFSRKDWRARALSAVCFALISFLPLGLWMIRNFAISGTLFGPRLPSDHTIPQSIEFTSNVLLSWFVPAAIIAHRSLLLVSSLVIGFLMGLVWKGDFARWRTLFVQLASILLFIVIYTAVLIASSSTAAIDPIDDRYLSPIFVPLSIFLFVLVEQLAERMTKYRSPALVKTVLITASAIWLIWFPLRSTISDTLNRLNEGAGGFSTLTWKESTLFQYLAKQPIGTDNAIYSNAPDVLYVLADIKGKMSPTKTMDNCRVQINDISKLKGAWPSESGAYLIWSDKVDWRCYLFTPEELSTIADVRLITRLGDGEIYSVQRSQ